MSYILEALKKADQERVVGKVPDLDSMHDPAAPPPPRRKFRWIWILGALVVVNGLLVAALMLRNNAADGGPDQAAADRVPAMETGRTPVARPAVPPRRVVPPRQPATRSPVRPYVPPTVKKPVPASETTAAVSPPAAKVAGTVTRAEKPLDATPVPETPVPAPAPVVQQPVARAAPVKPASGLPYWDDLSLEFRSGFTAPRIDVHVYDTDPQRRFILVDLKKYREGDSLASGAVLEQITPEGVQLSVRGKQFIYRR